MRSGVAQGCGDVQMEPSKTILLPDFRMMIWPLTTSMPAFNSVCSAVDQASSPRQARPPTLVCIHVPEETHAHKEHVQEQAGRQEAQAGW